MSTQHFVSLLTRPFMKGLNHLLLSPEEAEHEEVKSITPYWRTLKMGGVMKGNLLYAYKLNFKGQVFPRKRVVKIYCYRRVSDIGYSAYACSTTW
jgi:hypothetical protein